MQDRKPPFAWARAVRSAMPFAVAASLLFGEAFPAAAAPAQAASATVPAATAGPGVPFTADKLSSLLPATVYFQGRTAPLQIRNAAGTSFGTDEILWASLVDTSGYSTSVQERYQFYLVSEGPIRVGDVSLPAGAYGAGFLGDHFLIMDLGGHTVAQGPVQNDTELRRPRPLQMLPNKPNSVKLYLGRHWVLVQADTTARR